MKPETKFCRDCKQIKSVSEFFHHSRNKGPAYICKACAALRKTNYRNTNKLKLLRELGITSCARCTENHLACLDFHHVEDDKLIGVGKLLYRSTDKAIAECRKCIVLCANCHRKEHYPNSPTL